MDISRTFLVKGLCYWSHFQLNHPKPLLTNAQRNSAKGWLPGFCLSLSDWNESDKKLCKCLCEGAGCRSIAQLSGFITPHSKVGTDYSLSLSNNKTNALVGNTATAPLCYVLVAGLGSQWLTSSSHRNDLQTDRKKWEHTFTQWRWGSEHRQKS